MCLIYNIFGIYCLLRMVCSKVWRGRKVESIRENEKREEEREIIIDSPYLNVLKIRKKKKKNIHLVSL